MREVRKYPVINRPKKLLVKASLIAGAVILAALLGFFFQMVRQLPDVATISSYTPFETTEILAADGEIIGSLHQEENRTVVPLSQISLNLQKAVVAAEDMQFYGHHGVNLRGIIRALMFNIVRGHIVQGGSTITQQLARSLFLTPQRTISRKLLEIIMAMRIERNYTKDEILELYLNQVYWGHNAYGAEAAGQIYFGKHAKDLNIAEAALLAGIISGPELYSPYKDFKAAKLRQKITLERLVESKYISEEQAREAFQRQIRLTMGKFNKYRYSAPYFTSYVINQLVEKYGSELIYNGGLRVFTTLDVRMQKAAEGAVTQQINSEGARYGFSEAAMVAIDPRNGYIKALVGGADFDRSEYNRVTQSRRQPGSSFKPFLYTAALEKGLSPSTVVVDSPITIDVPMDKQHPDGKWRPKNFDLRFRGPVTIRYAVENSLNVPAIKVIQKIGVDPVIDMARRMGIRSELRGNTSLALGTSEVKLLEMVSAFGVLANNGVRVEPVAILKVMTRDGRTLEKHYTGTQKVLSQNTAATMVDIMKGVLLRGTGYKGRINRPAAAKTGTTEEFRDAWFIGFVPQLVTGVWIGNDNNRSMHGVAEVAVCPRMWKSFMDQALQGEPVLNFPAPEGLDKVNIKYLNPGDTGKSKDKAKPGAETTPPAWLKDILDNPPPESNKDDQSGE